MGLNQAGIILDTWDISIFQIIKKEEGIAIEQVREKIGVTHASLIPHLKRLEAVGLISRKRDKQTIHLETNAELKEYFPLLEKMKINLLKSDIKERFKKKFEQNQKNKK